MKVKHLKTGNIYEVVGEAIDATNAHRGQEVVIYRRDGQTYVREKGEFWQKFEKEPNRCCVCGTTENLRYDGAWYGHRCNSPDCMVF
jgi:hypothetical protein